MQTRYFNTAWQDIKHSPGWFGRFCLLALLCFIPVFGAIVLLAFAFGWAREIAWGTHKPMPSKIISNEDGRFWRRGWFVLLVFFVFLIIPVALGVATGSIETREVVWTLFGPQMSTNTGMLLLQNVLQLVALVLMVLLSILAFIGSMRVAIYDRLSSGFQLGTIVRMLRHDARGIVRIVGMYLLVGLILGIILAVIAVILIVPLVFAVLNTIAGWTVSPEYLQYMAATEPFALLFQVITSVGFLGLVLLVVFLYLSNVASVFLTVLVVRAMGYWTMGFEVALWGGQDDPLPFELASNPAAAQTEIPLPNTPAQQKLRASQGTQPPVGQPVVPPANPAAPVNPVNPPTEPPSNPPLG